MRKPYEFNEIAQRSTRNVLLDFGNAAIRLDKPGFAGVCPVASPDPADTKIRAIGGRGATANLSRMRPRFVRKGLSPDQAR